MSDIKLFKINRDISKELESDTFISERELQKLIEENMEVVLGVKFLQSEYVMGEEYIGRIDSLGIDNNDCPVIIEYKRSINKNVINQGLFYLDWILSNKAEFKLLVMDKLGREYVSKIEWSPRLLCIASDFTKYDMPTVKRIGNIELIRYKKYNDDILLLEQVIAGYTDIPDKVSRKTQKPRRSRRKSSYKTFSEKFKQLDNERKILYHAVADFTKSLGNDVEKIEWNQYVEFKRTDSIISILPRPRDKFLLLYLCLDPEEIPFPSGSSDSFPKFRNMRNEGNSHSGNGDLEIKISNKEDFEQIKHLIVKSYEAN